MHILQPKHTKLKQEEVSRLIKELNISISQLPKISHKDPALPEGFETGEVIKIERKDEDGKIIPYYRVII